MQAHRPAPALHDELRSRPYTWPVKKGGVKRVPALQEVLKTRRERAVKFNVEKVKQEDLASAGGSPDETD